LFRRGFDGGDFGECGSSRAHWIGRDDFNRSRSFRNNDRHDRNCNCNCHESHRPDRHPKSLLAGIAAVAVTAGVGTYVIQQVTAAPPVAIGGSAVRAASPRETLPIVLANDSFLVTLSDKKFLVEFESEHSAHEQLRSRHSYQVPCYPDFGRFRRFP